MSPRPRSAWRSPALLASAAVLLGGLAPSEAVAAPPGLTLSAAVRSALSRHPQLRGALERVEVARGRLMSARGTFDEYVDAEVSYARGVEPILPEQRALIGADSVTQDNLTTRLGASKTLRWGTRVRPSVGLTRSSRGLDPRTGPADVFNRGTVELRVEQPILRAVGDSSAVVAERAAELELKAAAFDAEAVAQALVREVANAYWAYAASVQRLELLTRSEALAQKTAADTRALIAADERPASDAIQLEATEADRRRQRVQAESALFGARRRLGLAMGLLDGAAIALRPPARGVPARAVRGGYRPALSPDALEAALARRPDVLAAHHRLASADLVAEAADWNTLPELDLSFGIGYSGRLDGSGPDDLLGALVDNPGLTVGAGVSLTLPVRNSTQRGAQLRLLAVRRQAELSLTDLVRGVRANVAIRHNQLMRAADAVSASDQALALFERALEAETEKVAAELGTVLDLVLSQERMLGAQIARIDARLSSAQAFVEVSYEGGALPARADDEDALRRFISQFPEEAP